MTKDRNELMCKICGKVVHQKDFCYYHFVEIRKLKMLNQEIPAIKAALKKEGKLKEKTDTTVVAKRNKCTVCGQPATEDLCIIHKKINEFLNRE